MRAMMLTGLRAMEWREVPTPAPRAADEVLLKMAAVGVCGSDIHYYTVGRIGSQVVRYPFTVGHEGAAVVEAVGAAVTRVKPGDRVAVEPAMSCGHCDQCRHGRPHTCRRLRFLGCPGQAEGCLSEYLVMPQACCYPAGGLSLEQAALSEPLAIGFYAALRGMPLKGARIAILGAGPIGLSVLVCTRARGAAAIYVTDKLAARREMALGAGADWAGDPDSKDFPGPLAAREPLLLDAVFECCGDQAAVDQAAGAAERNDPLAFGLAAAGVHSALVERSGNTTLTTLSQLLDHMVRAYYTRNREIDQRLMRRAVRGYNKLLDLIRAGDEAGAVEHWDASMRYTVAIRDPDASLTSLSPDDAPDAPGART